MDFGSEPSELGSLGGAQQSHGGGSSAGDSAGDCIKVSSADLHFQAVANQDTASWQNLVHWHRKDKYSGRVLENTHDQQVVPETSASQSRNELGQKRHALCEDGEAC